MKTWYNEKTRTGAGRVPMLDMEKDPKNTKTYYLSSDGTLKRKVQILIDNELFREASIVAQEIYGRGRGGLSLLISVLLKKFIDDYKAKKSVELPDSHRKTVKDIFLEVLKYIADKRQCTMDEIVDILEKELAEAIASTRGSDKRTIKKWIELFASHNLIQYKGGFHPNRIFRVNHEKLE